MIDAIILSDIHLGSDVCQAACLDSLLKKIENDSIQTQRLIINGDLFDSLNMNKLPKSHWQILKELRKLTKKTEVIWICGNHDGHYEHTSTLLGLELHEEYKFESGQQKITCLHGDKFDSFIQKHPILKKIADMIYWIMQKIDTTHTLAIRAKTNSKTFLRNTVKIRNEAIKHAKKQKANIIICGHTHHAETTIQDGTWYANSGCWTDKNPTYLTISNGAVHLIKL